ncbi:MAG: hypothetical protein HQL50_13340 [Magnetococcales bacterium]|nr:hypothetical protein [Magnetococcales bacterium]
MSTSDANKQLAGIQIVQGNTHRERLQEDAESPKEDNWTLAVNSLKQLSRAGNWEEAHESLIFLANQENHPEVYRAKALAVWLALKTDVPIAQLTSSFYKLLIGVGPDHESAPALASLANLMLHHRTPDHPDRELAQLHVHQMFQYVSEVDGITDQEGFKSWVEENHLDDPDIIIPMVMQTLEEIMGDLDWIDRDRIQDQLMQDNTERANA